MEANPYRLKLSTNTIKSVENQVDNSKEYDLSKKINAKKGNTIVLIKGDPSEMSFITPLFCQNAFYAAEIPILAKLFFAQAIEYENKSIAYVNLFPDHVNYTLASGAKFEIKMVDQRLYNLFLMNKISAVISLTMSVESFLNSIIPDKFVLEDSNMKFIEKKEIEKNWDLKRKLKEVVPLIKIIDNQAAYLIKVNKFVQLSKLRNEFIHLKTKLEASNGDPFIVFFEELINLNLKLKIKETQELINHISPGYLK